VSILLLVGLANRGFGMEKKKVLNLLLPISDDFVELPKSLSFMKLFNNKKSKIKYLHTLDGKYLDIIKNKIHILNNLPKTEKNNEKYLKKIKNKIGDFETSNKQGPESFCSFMELLNNDVSNSTYDSDFSYRLKMFRDFALDEPDLVVPRNPKPISLDNPWKSQDSPPGQYFNFIKDFRLLTLKKIKKKKSEMEELN